MPERKNAAGVTLPDGVQITQLPAEKTAPESTAVRRTAGPGKRTRCPEWG